MIKPILVDAMEKIKKAINKGDKFLKFECKQVSGLKGERCQ
jgi:hypothetical protein